MKQILGIVCLLLGLMLSAAERAEEDADFKTLENWQSKWMYYDSNYYRPYGEVTNDANGMKITTNGKTENLILAKTPLDVAPDEEFEITVTVSAQKKSAFFVGLIEYRDNVFVQSDLQTKWTEGKSQEYKIKVKATMKGKSFNKAYVTVGAAKGHEVTFEKIKVARLAQDDDKRVAGLPHGIMHHFDAAKEDSIVLKDGAIVEWKDRSGKKESLVPVRPDSAPVLVNKNLNGKAVVRFDGKKKQELQTGKGLSLLEGINVFVVFKRDDAQSGGETWQDALYWGDGTRPDNTGYAHLDLGANAGAQPPTVFSRMSKGGVVNKLTVGSNASKRGYVSGDIAEIIIYERELSSAESDKICQYLRSKWNFTEDDYVRLGPITEPAKRISEKLPLSDQANTGKWTLDETMSDEFNGSSLDRSKWVDMTFYNLGDPPSRCLPENIEFKDGTINLVSKYDPEFKGGRLKPRGPEYHSYTVGNIFSRNHVRYGYIEARAKIQKSAFSSTFWLIGGGIRRADGWSSSPEIDIYELAGKSFAHTYSYCMAVHDAVVKPEGKSMASGKIWKSNFNFTDDYHVYGLEWTPKHISWYVDGHLVRKLTHQTPADNRWDIGMTVNIGTETQFSWFGIPETGDLPSTYSIDYVRVWKNEETTMKDDWKQKYENRHVMHDKGFAFDYIAKNGTKFVPGPNTEDSLFKSEDMGILDQANASAWKTQAGAKVEKDPKGLKFTFPASVLRKDNGEVQYLTPGTDWPQATISNPKIDFWGAFKFIAVDYENPGPDVQAVGLGYTTESGKTGGGELIMKVGTGVGYIPIRVSEKIVSVNFNVRGSSKQKTFFAKTVRLEE